MTDFDPVKSLKEEISGLIDVRGTLFKREREIEARFGELEIELNSFRKLRGFADVALASMRESLAKMETK